MRFLTLYYPAAPEGRPPTQEEIEQMGRFMTDAVNAGVLVATGGLLPSGAGARVRQAKGEVTVTDGPFAETKEIVGGYAVMECSRLADAVDWTKRFLAIAGDGTAEVREMHPDPLADLQAAKR